MATYRVMFVETFTVTIDAANDEEARQKADGMLVIPLLQIQYAPTHWQRGWNDIRRDGGDD